MIKLIAEHKDYLLLVDTVKSSGDYVYGVDGKIYGKHDFMLKISCRAIIAHLPLQDAHILEGVPLLPCPFPEKDCVSKELCKSKGYCIHPFAELPKQEEEVDWAAKMVDEHNWDFNICLAAYKAASKKWSDEDMRECWRQASRSSKYFEEYLQSLSSKSPIGFVLSDKYLIFEENLKHGKYIY